MLFFSFLFQNFDLKSMADKGYKMIFSNVDSLYLDCGFGAWVGEGNNWCTPYKGWQKIYSNDLYKNLEEQGVKINDNNKKLVLGAEVCMWAEQVLFLKKIFTNNTRGISHVVNFCLQTLGRFRDGRGQNFPQSSSTRGAPMDKPK